MGAGLLSHEDFGFCFKCTKAETQMSLLPDPVIHQFTPQTLVELQLAPCLSPAGSSEDDPFSYGKLPLEDVGVGEGRGEAPLTILLRFSLCRRSHSPETGADSRSCAVHHRHCHPHQ